MGSNALTGRRRLLQFLAGSPLLGGTAAFAQEVQRLPDPMVWGPRTLDKLIATPREALDVFDLELVAHKNLPPAHFGYMASGVDDDATLRANRDGFQKSSSVSVAWSMSESSTRAWNCSARPMAARSSWRRPAPIARSTKRARSPSRALPGPAIT